MIQPQQDVDPHHSRELQQYMKRDVKGAMPQQLHPAPWYQNNVEAQQQNPNVFIQPGISNQFLNQPDFKEEHDDF